MELKKILEYCVRHNGVYCYGAGLYGKIVRTYLAENDIDILGFIVSDGYGEKTSVLGDTVFTISEYLNIRNESDGVVVSVSEMYQNAVKDALKIYAITDTLFIDDEMFRCIEQKCEYKTRYVSNNNITVFCYHRVADLPIDTWKLAVKPDLFERQIEYIKNNYIVLRSDGDWNRAEGKAAAIITFDDGYEDMYSKMLPILERYKVPATVFVCMGNIDTSNEFWWDELERVVYSAAKEGVELLIEDEMDIIKLKEDPKENCYILHPYLKNMNFNKRAELLRKWSTYIKSPIERNYCRSMSKQQLIELASSDLITIGGHTITHSCLASETKEQQKWEIGESKREIEEIIDKKIRVFSYPFGQKEDFTKETVEIAKEVGYERVFAAFSGMTNAGYTNGYIPRVNIGQESDFYKSIRLLRKYETIHGDERT